MFAEPGCKEPEPNLRTARASGLWSARATWGGVLPKANDSVAIPAGLRVILNVNPPPLNSLTVKGTLRVAPINTNLSINWMMVHGLFEVGTQSAPFKNRMTITLRGSNPAVNKLCGTMEMGAKFINAMRGGRIVMHTPRGTSWTHLNQNVVPGTRQIRVAAALGWRAGDSIVIAPQVAIIGQTERRIVTKVQGKLLTLDRPLNYHHSGTRPVISGKTLDMRSEVARLTRPIVIQGDTASNALQFGGHVMIMEGGSAQIDGVQFVRMGQRNLPGRYPFHWHLVGSAAGQYLRNCAIDGSFQRGIVVHGTSNAVVAGNVVYDTTGHNISVEDPASQNNLFTGNLALENRKAVFTKGELAGQGDEQPANFWIRSARNTFTYNVAAASTAHGFWYDSITDGGTVFYGNTAHSSYSLSDVDFVRDSGLFVVNVGEQILEFSDSLFYQNGTGIWPSEMGGSIYRNMVFADHWNGTAVVMDTSGATNVFQDNLFVGRTRKPVSGESDSGGPGGAMLIQYSGQAALVNPIFAEYGDSTLLGANDIFVEWQAEYSIRGARFVNTSSSALALHEGAINVLQDASFGLAAGVYVNIERPQLIASGGVPAGQDEEGNALYLRSDFLPGYAMLRTHIPGGNTFSEPWHMPANTIRRSDGLRYQDDTLNGFRLICGGLYRYDLEATPPGNHLFFTLDNHGTPMPMGVTQTAIFTVPLDTIPLSVARIDELNEDTVPANPASRLVRVFDRKTFEENPLNSWFYDPIDRRLHLQGNERWLVIQR